MLQTNLSEKLLTVNKKYMGLIFELKKRFRNRLIDSLDGWLDSQDISYIAALEDHPDLMEL